MARTVTGGQYRRNGEGQQYAVPNDSTTFPTLAARGPLPPRGTQATATLKRPPNTPYALRDHVVYEDGNNNNTVHVDVTRVDGPSKYGLTVR